MRDVFTHDGIMKYGVFTRSIMNCFDGFGFKFLFPDAYEKNAISNMRFRLFKSHHVAFYNR